MLKKLLIARTVGGLAIASTYFAAPTLAQGPGTIAPASVEKHPIIRRSIIQLGKIETELAKADNDFKGHKERARDLIRQAMGELKLAIASDRN